MVHAPQAPIGETADPGKSNYSHSLLCISPEQAS